MYDDNKFSKPLRVAILIGFSVMGYAAIVFAYYTFKG